MKQRIRQMIGVALILFVGSIPLHSAPTKLKCDNGDCVTVLVTSDEGWSMSINCEDNDGGFWSGDGSWAGTICGVEVNGG